LTKISSQQTKQKLNLWIKMKRTKKQI